MSARKISSKKSRRDLYRQHNSPGRKESSPEPEFQMTQVQKVILYSCAGVGILMSWVLQAILGLNGFLTTTIMSGIGGGVGGLVAMGIILMILTPDQKRKHLKRKKR